MGLTPFELGNGALKVGGGPIEELGGCVVGGPLLGTKLPGGKLPGGKLPCGKLPGGKLPDGKLPGTAPPDPIVPRFDGLPPRGAGGITFVEGWLFVAPNGKSW